MSSTKKILMICDSDLSREPRMIRQIIALKDAYQIYTLGAKASGIAGVEHFNIAVNDEQPLHWQYRPWARKAMSGYLRLRQTIRSLHRPTLYEAMYWTKARKQALSQLKDEKFDVIITHHWDGLPLADALARKQGARLVFNAHDYYSRQFEDHQSWRVNQQPQVQYIMDHYVPHCNLIFSAWTKIHEDYQQKYHVPSLIVNNATEYNNLSPQFRPRDQKEIRLIHHGIANANRKIEVMIQMMNHLDARFYLDLMLMPSSDGEYLNGLIRLAEKNPNIRFLDPVPTREIAKMINNYDIGLFLLPPNGFNPTYTLPNKLFEFIQARLAVLVTPNIEMKTIVEKYDLGWVAGDFEPRSAALKIKDVCAEELNQKKVNAHASASELCAEKNYVSIKKAIDDLALSN